MTRKTAICTIAEFMAWYYGEGEYEWDSTDLESCDFAFELIDGGIFKSHKEMESYLRKEAEQVIEVTSIEDGYTGFTTTFITAEGIFFDLFSLTAIGEPIE